MCVCMYICVYIYIHGNVFSQFNCFCLCNPLDCSPSGSSPMGIFQAITLEWIASSGYIVIHIYNFYLLYICIKFFSYMCR